MIILLFLLFFIFIILFLFIYHKNIRVLHKNIVHKNIYSEHVFIIFFVSLSTRGYPQKTDKLPWESLICYTFLPSRMNSATHSQFSAASLGFYDCKFK